MAHMAGSAHAACPALWRSHRIRLAATSRRLRATPLAVPQQPGLTTPRP